MTTFDVRFNDPLLNDAFDFSRYPTFKARTANPSALYELKHRVRGGALFRGSPPRVETRRRTRNVSEPQLVSSTNHMRESWFTNVTSACTVGDIANLSNDNDVCSTICSSQSTSVIPGTPVALPRCDAEKGQLQNTPSTSCEDSCDILKDVEPSESKFEEDSLYSMDSADPDTHPLLLSMPVIPQIKLERKATVRKPDPIPLSDPAKNQTFLSPRMRDLSARRYGRILARTGSPEAVPNVLPTKTYDHSTTTSQPSRRFMSTGSCDRAENRSTKLVYARSASEPGPMFNSDYQSDDEEEPLLKKGTDDALHSDVLLSMIEEAGGSFPGPRSNRSELDVGKPVGGKQVPTKRPKRGHQRSSVSHSLSFSSIVNAVADGCASLDLLHRRPKTKSTTEPKPRANARDPTSKWAPKQGRIIIKVFVPSTDDIWSFGVPQNISLADFTSLVVSKLGFPVSFSGSLWDEPSYYFKTDERFKSWVKERIRFGRNLPIVAHALPPLPLVKLNVDEDGCEVWCYA